MGIRYGYVDFLYNDWYILDSYFIFDDVSNKHHKIYSIYDVRYSRICTLSDRMKKYFSIDFEKVNHGN